MNYTIEKDINKAIITDANDKTFNDYIEDYTHKKKVFYNIAKDNIYNRYNDRKDNFKTISKMLNLELLDYTFKHLNEHQQKIFFFNSDLIDKAHFSDQLKEYKDRRQGGLYANTNAT